MDAFEQVPRVAELFIEHRCAVGTDEENAQSDTSFHCNDKCSYELTGDLLDDEIQWLGKTVSLYRRWKSGMVILPCKDKNKFCCITLRVQNILTRIDGDKSEKVLRCFSTIRFLFFVVGRRAEDYDRRENSRRKYFSRRAGLVRGRVHLKRETRILEQNTVCREQLEAALLIDER